MTTCQCSYQYSIKNDIITSQLSAGQLHETIKTFLVLTSAKYIGINTNADVMYITFSEEITNLEKIDLDLLVSNHQSISNTQIIEYITFYPKITDISSTNYFSIGTVPYSGTLNVGTITSIDVIGYLDNGVTSADIQIINRDNNAIICTENFYSSSLTTFNFTNIDNVPQLLSLLDISIKINKNGNSTKYAHIDKVILWLQ
jgi:hypothetical protein